MTAMSRHEILRRMRESTARRKRADAAAQSRARADTARARLDALSARLDALSACPRPAPVDPLAAAAERARRLAPYRADMERERQRHMIDLLACASDAASNYEEWSLR